MIFQTTGINPLASCAGSAARESSRRIDLALLGSASISPSTRSGPADRGIPGLMIGAFFRGKIPGTRSCRAVRARRAPQGQSSDVVLAAVRSSAAAGSHGRGTARQRAHAHRAGAGRDGRRHRGRHGGTPPPPYEQRDQRDHRRIGDAARSGSGDRGRPDPGGRRSDGGSTPIDPRSRGRGRGHGRAVVPLRAWGRVPRPRRRARHRTRRRLALRDSSAIPADARRSGIRSRRPPTRLLGAGLARLTCLPRARARSPDAMQATRSSP